jgi:hypothetical protein
LAQTVTLSPETGFLWNALQWIKTFIMFENDVQWIGSCLDFLLKVEGGAEDDSALEQSLLTIASVLTRRLLVFDWLALERKLVFQRLVDRVQGYFGKQDSVMEDVSLGSKNVDRGLPSAALRAMASSKVQVELSGGISLNTFPEILRLALLVMSVGDVSKQGAFSSHGIVLYSAIFILLEYLLIFCILVLQPIGVSTWSRLFQDVAHTHSDQPKRLQNGSALLHCNPPLSNDIQFRLRIIQGSKDPEIVKVALDGLNLVQTIELCKDGFGLDLQVAQLAHTTLLVALENEASQAVPVHLEAASGRRELFTLVVTWCIYTVDPVL